MEKRQQNNKTSQRRPNMEKRQPVPLNNAQQRRPAPQRRQSPQRNVQMSDDKRIAMRTAQRRKKNKRKKILIRIIVCLLFIIAGIILTLTMFFKINNVTVTGESQYSSDEVINSSGIAIEDNLIFIPQDKIKEDIMKKLPYIGEVTIKKHLPSSVELIVKKTEAVYAVPQDGLYTLLDSNGKVLEKGIEYVSENLIFLNPGEIKSMEPGNIAEMKDSDVMQKVKSVHDGLMQCGYDKISLIDATNIYNIKFIYDGRITFELGELSKTNLIKKLQLGKSALERQNEENEQYRGTINLTVEGKGYWSEEVVTTEPPTKVEETNENGEIVETTKENSEETTVKNKEEETKKQ